MSIPVKRTIEAALGVFPENERQHLQDEIVAYLDRLGALRSELERGENDLMEGREVSLEELDDALGNHRAKLTGQ
jgi:hypothetical protein